MENHHNAPSLPLRPPMSSASLLSSSSSSSLSSVLQEGNDKCSDHISEPYPDSLNCHQFMPISPEKYFVQEVVKARNGSDLSSSLAYREKFDKSSPMDFEWEDEKSIEGLLQSVDVSDLSFLSNDFLLGDCNCLEQASQFVDPALKDSDSTPFSFNNNNNDLVQLFKSGLNDSNKDCTILNLQNNNNNNNCDSSSKNCKKNERLPLKFDGVRSLRSSFNVDLLGSLYGSCQLNNQGEHDKRIQIVSKQRKNEGKRVLGGGGPIKRGRRYLPNFKQKVIEYAKTHTYKETASHFHINSNTITEWFREINGKSSTEEKQHYNSHKFTFDKSKNHKTDKLASRISKTEVILLDDDICFETDNNEPSSKTNKMDINTASSSPPSPSASTSFDTSPDEMFLRWIRKKRLEKKELSRQEVFQIAKYYLNERPTTMEPSSWFILWLNRFNKVLNSVTSNVQIEKYIKYPSSFKLEVVLYARLFTKNSAARIFNVPRKRAFDWCSRLVPIESNPQCLIQDAQEAAKQTEEYKMDFASKKDETKEKIYAELHLWYQNMFFNRTRPTSNDIKKKAREIFSFYGLKEIKFSDGWLQKFCQRTNIKLRHSEDDELLLWVLAQFDNNVSLSHQDITEKSSTLIGRKRFKGSKGWTLRFLKRHRNLLQRSPTFADQLPPTAQQKLTLFWDNFHQNLISFKVTPENIGCMDEIPLSFNYPEEGNSTSMPLLRKTGFENCQGIVILSSLASGRLLPPTVIFKGTQPKQMFSIRNLDILVLYQEKGLVTVDILETWMTHVWFSYASSPSALVVDSFEPHRTKRLAHMLARENCLLHVIPEGCSCKFQPLDVNLTPSFKEAIKNQWKEFPAGSDVPLSKLGRNYRCPDRDTILNWIQNAYEKLKKNPVSITNSFKTIGLLQ